MATASCGTDLSTRSDGRDLPAWSGELKMLSLLDADAAAADWRIVEVFSRSDLPFELHLAWSAGSGAGAEARVTVARSARVCVYARGLRIRAGNLADAINRVGVTVADAYAVTENQWETTGELEQQVAAIVPADVLIPPFARRVRVEMADPTQLPTTTIKVYDGLAVLRSTVPGDQQPAEGVPVGGARTLEITAGEASAWRAVFTLSL